jgi:hypothetical protein
MLILPGGRPCLSSRAVSVASMLRTSSGVSVLGKIRPSRFFPAAPTTNVMSSCRGSSASPRGRKKRSRGPQSSVLNARTTLARPSTNFASSPRGMLSSRSSIVRFAALRVAALSTYFHTVAGQVRWAIWTRNLGGRSISCPYTRSRMTWLRSRAARAIVSVPESGMVMAPLLSRAASKIKRSALSRRSRTAAPTTPPLYSPRRG